MRKSRTKWIGMTIGWVAIVMTARGVAQATPCKGVKRLQLRWAANTRSALVSLSATLCDPAPACPTTGASQSGVLLTKSPIAIIIKDASGRALSGVVNPADPACGAGCGQINRGGCPGGADIHHISGGFVRYMYGNRGQTSVVANKLKIPASEAPSFTAPITVIFTDAKGYAVEAEMKNCRVRQSATGTTISCS